MKVVLLRPVEVDVATLRIDVPVKYDDEEMPYDFLFRREDRWSVHVDVDSGKVLGWPQGSTAKVRLTVKDEGKYELMDRAGEQVWFAEEDYVPRFLPGFSGDRLELDIAPDGTILNWRGSASIANFLKDKE